MWAETCLIYTLKLWALAALEFLCTASANTDVSCLFFFFLLNRQWGKDHLQQEKPWLLRPLVESFVVFLVHLLLSANAEEPPVTAAVAGTWGAPMPQLQPVASNPPNTMPAKKYQVYQRWWRWFQAHTSPLPLSTTRNTEAERVPDQDTSHKSIYTVTKSTPIPFFGQNMNVSWIVMAVRFTWLMIFILLDGIQQNPSWSPWST